MSKIGFPSNPSGGAEHKWRSRRRFNYDNTRGGWAASGGSFASDAPALNSNTSISDFNDSTGLANKLTGKAALYNTYNDLPTEAYKGTFAYVADTNKLYMWTGAEPVTAPVFVGDVAVFAGGTQGASWGTVQNTVDYTSISTPANATDLGDLSRAAYLNTSMGDGSRGLTTGYNYHSNSSTEINYWSYSTPGNAVGYFGAQVSKLYAVGGFGDGTYGIWGGGAVSGNPASNIQYVTVQTTGSATQIGNLSVTLTYLTGLCDGIWGLFAGGTRPGVDNAIRTNIEFMTTATLSGTSTWGDLSVGRTSAEAICDGVRGIFAGGGTDSQGTQTDLIDYITVQTQGTAQSFGNLTTASSGYMGATDGTTGVFANEDIAGSTSFIDQISTTTGGTATDYGYGLSVHRRAGAASSGS